MLLALTVLADPKAGKKLVFDAEFNKNGAVNTREWKFDDGPVYNDELEKYASGSGDNAIVEGGNLVITARKENGKITSARLQSIKSWKYGYFEVRAKVPSGRGTWPAIWMLSDSLRHPGGPGWPACGEVDIMENVGYDPDAFHFSLHSAKYNWMKKEQRTQSVPCANATADFHVFGFDWEPNRIEFYIDGKAVYTVDRNGEGDDGWPFNKPFFFILNLAIGGSWGGAKGVDDAIFPARFLVDYVRVYQGT